MTVRLSAARCLLALTVAASSGCGGRGTGGTTGATVGGSPADWRGDSAHPLARRMRELAERMEDAGLEVGPIEGQGFLASNDRVTVELDLPEGRCATIVAIATSGVSDIDATLYDASGQILAEDKEPDAHPTIQLCGESGRRFYYYLHTYEGAGAYLFASFEGDRESFAEAARIVGGRPGVVGPDAAGDGGARLRELEQGVTRRGFEPLRDPHEVTLASEQRVRVPLPVKESHCYTVAAFAQTGLTNVDLRVLDEVGQEQARDDSASRDAQAQLCVDRDGDYSVELHAAGGTGKATVATYEGPMAAVGGPSGLWLGRRPDTLRSGRSVDEALEEATVQAREAGWSSTQEKARGDLVQAQAVAHGLTLQPGRCTLVLGTGGEGIGQLRMRVVDGEGRTLSEHPARGPTVSARVCAEHKAEVHVHLIARAGGGKYALHTMRKAPPDDLLPGVSIWDRGAVLDALEQAEAEGWSPVEPPRAVSLPARVDVGRGRCERVHVVAARIGGRVSGELHRGERIGVRRGGRAFELIACPREGAPDPELVVRAEGETRRAYILRFQKRES